VLGTLLHDLRMLLREKDISYFTLVTDKS
jgi:hypothetical protein